MMIKEGLIFEGKCIIIKKMRQILIFLGCILFFGFSSLAYSDPTSTQEQAASPTAVKESSVQNVKTIEIRGNKLISTSKIISQIKTRANQPYYARIARDDIKRLYDTGFFTDVKMDTEEESDGTLKVVFVVEEKLIAEDVIFQGNHALSKQIIKEKVIKTKASEYIDQNKLREDVENLKGEYNKRGYSNAEVEYSLEVNKETGKAKVAFKIKENKRVRIKRVYFQGNGHIGKNKLIKVMKTRMARLFQPGFFKDGEFQDDLERLKVLYNSEGFSDVTIDSKTEYDKRGFMYITLLINEGAKYYVGKVTISGNEDFTNEELESKLAEAVSGKVFSDMAMQKDISNLQNFYLGKGYLFAQVKESAAANLDSGKVDIAYRIVENEVAYVERIDIRGNTKTKDKVIRREIRLKPGEKFDGDKLKRSKERLDNLGFFEEVSFDNEPGTESDKQNLIVNVKEAQTGMLSFGGGYSSVSEFIGFVEVEQKNFDLFNFPSFTGAGQDLTLRTELGSVIQNFDMSFTEPWLFDHPVSGGFDLYRHERDREKNIGYGYNEKRVGGDVRFGKEFSEYVKGKVALRTEEITISNVSDDATADLMKEIGTNTLNSIEFELIRDTRDNIYNPSKGVVLSGEFDCTGGPVGGDKDFLRLFGTNSYYLSSWHKSVVELTLRTGALLTYSDTDEIPVFNRFYAGGANTIRGYHERKVGPIDPVSEDPIGGESIFIGNIEYTYPLLEFIKAATFFDIGNVWRKVEDFGFSGLKSSFGFGLRVKTPIGPIKLDYGFPLNLEPGEEDKEGQFHFSMSRGF